MKSVTFFRCAVTALAGLAVSGCGTTTESAPPSPPARSIASIRLSPSELRLTSYGDTATIGVTVVDQFGVPYASSVTATATGGLLISSTGLVTAPNFNTSGTITFSSGGVSAVASVYVTQVPARLLLTPASLRFTYLGGGVGERISWQITDARGNRIVALPEPRWSTNNATVATVSSFGTVNAVGNGSAIVTAVSGALRDSVPVIVAQQPHSIRTTPIATASLRVGETFQFLATVLDFTGNPIPNVAVTWSSLTPSIVSVSSTGLVTGRATGQGTIVASSGGLSMSILVFTFQ